MTSRNLALAQISEVYETSELKEVAQKLSSGDWIAICATTAENPMFVLGKLAPLPRFFQENK